MSTSTIAVKDGTTIYYKDRGKGQPLVFHHGWPLSADEWDAQMMFFLERGYRVIAHDRRGHGRSTQTDTGNEMDTYAADVNELVLKLDLRDDLKAIDVPTLVMHGEDDQIVPFADAGPFPEAAQERHHSILLGPPPGMPTVRADVINPDLLAFIKGTAKAAV